MKNLHRNIFIALFLILGVFGLALAQNATEATEEKPAAEVTDQVFTDVDTSSKFYVPLKFLKEQKLVQGFEDGTFHPEKAVTRAEALAMVLKVSGKETQAAGETEKTVKSGSPLEIELPAATTITLNNPTTGEKTILENVKSFQVTAKSGTSKVSFSKPSEEKPFKDVSEKDWFYEMVIKAKKIGLVKGYDDGKYFKPNDEINLAETLRILFQCNKINTELNDHPLPAEINKDAWFAKDIAYAVFRTMLLQQENGTVFPAEKELNRGEMAMILYRFVKTKENAVYFGLASWYGDGLAKTKIPSGMEYKERNLTAAHKSIPFGTILQVTNMENGKQVKVVVNDRGPYVTGRIIDLSKSAFAELESPGAGIISVSIEAVDK